MILSSKSKCQKLQFPILDRERRKKKTYLLPGTLHAAGLDIVLFTFTDSMEITRETWNKSKTTLSLTRPTLLCCNFQHQEPSKIILNCQWLC